MMNMAYCRFTNTLEALRECQEAMDDHELSEWEQEARKKLIRLCAEITEWYGSEEDDE